MKTRLFAFSFIIVIVTAALLTTFWFAGATRAGVLSAGPAGFNTAPILSAITPNTAPNDLDTPVVISGAGFTAVLSGAQVITPPLAYMGDIPLGEVIFINSTTLNATLPWGLDPGVYTLTVQNPSGETGSLPNAFTVTQGLGVWTSNGPYGGGVAQLILHPVTPTIVYALGSDIGLFLSEDSGDHWEMVFRLPSLYADFEFDSQNPNLMYAGDQHGLYRTMDGTRTWEAISIRSGGWWKHDLAAHPTLPGVVYATVGSYTYPEQVGGVFRSDNYGTLWVTLTIGLTDTHFTSLAIHPVLTQTLIAGTQSGDIYYSVNDGQTWNWSTHLTDTVANLYFNPYEPLQAWATTDGENGLAPQLYNSEDLVHWTAITVGAGLSWGGIWDMDFLTNTIWATNHGAYFSKDGGNTWTPLSSSVQCGSPEWLAINPDNPQEMYSAPNLQGVCKSDDGGLTWRQTNDGLAAMKPLETAVSQSNPDTIYVRAPGLDIAKSENGGRAWRVLNIGIGGTPSAGLAVDPFESDRVYLNKMISEDGGDTWNPVTFTLPATFTGWNVDILTIAPHPSIPGHILAGLVTWPTDTLSTAESNIGLLYASDDYGDHWNFIGPSQVISYITQIAYDSEDTDLIYVATGGSALWRSSDGGQNWELTTLPEGRTNIQNVFTHPDRFDTVYVRTTKPYEVDRLFISLNAGETWTALPDVTGGPFYFAATQPPSLYSQCFVNGLMYLCRSWDGGYNWELIDEMQQEITALAGGREGERMIIYVGTKGGQVSSAPSVLSLNVTQLGSIPGRGSLMGAGIYRVTMLVSPPRLYLPLVTR